MVDFLVDSVFENGLYPKIVLIRNMIIKYHKPLEFQGTWFSDKRIWAVFKIPLLDHYNPQ